MIEQPFLPNFLEQEAKAREASIPLETRKERMVRLYWLFRKYAEKCPKNDWENRKRAWMMSMMLERQR